MSGWRDFEAFLHRRTKKTLTGRALRRPSLFYPNRHRGDSQSYRYESKISVTYREHPQKDGLLVVGEVAYPNLDFEYTKVGRFKRRVKVLGNETMTKAAAIALLVHSCAVIQSVAGVGA